MGVLILSHFWFRVDRADRIGRVDTETSYMPQSFRPSNAIAQDFNATAALEFPPFILSSTFATFYQTIFANSQVVQLPTSCTDCPVRPSYRCDCYYFPESMIPGMGDLVEDIWDSLEIHAQPGISINLWYTDPGEVANSTQFECGIFGAPDEAFQFYIANSSAIKNHLVADSIPLFDILMTSMKCLSDSNYEPKWVYYQYLLAHRWPWLGEPSLFNVHSSTNRRHSLVKQLDHSISTELHYNASLTHHYRTRPFHCSQHYLPTSFDQFHLTRSKLYFFSTHSQHHNSITSG